MLACSGSETAGDAGPAGADAEADGAANRPELVDNASWRPYDRALDPLAREQPPEIDCGLAGFYPERGELEIDTSRCNYLLAEHPALRELPAGSPLTMELRHYDLVAPEPAEAHVAVLFGDALQWEAHVPIPHPAEVLEIQFTSTRALAAGDPVRLHLHNHGQNTWTFAYLRLAQSER